MDGSAEGARLIQRARFRSAQQALVHPRCIVAHTSGRKARVIHCRSVMQVTSRAAWALWEQSRGQEAWAWRPPRATSEMRRDMVVVVVVVLGTASSHRERSC